MENVHVNDNRHLLIHIVEKSIIRIIVHPAKRPVERYVAKN